MFQELLKKREEIYIGCYKTDRQPKLFPANHIFDENQSVKWNREQVELKNKNMLDDQKLERKMWLGKCKEVVNEILQKILEETNSNDVSCAEKLYNLAYQYAHNESIYVFNDYLNDLCDLVNMYMEVK